MLTEKRVEWSFQVGDYVYLKLKPYMQRSLHSKHVWKLSPKYAGPFQVLSKVGDMTYRLNLPPNAKVHPVFHVSVLKGKVGPVSTVSNSLLKFDEDGKVLLQLVKVLTRRLVRQGNSPATQLLVQYQNSNPRSSAGNDDISPMQVE